ncbi:MAG: hypothetical protein ACREBR_00985 [bacterium]
MEQDRTINYYNTTGLLKLRIRIMCLLCRHLESACGRNFTSARLQKLDGASLLETSRRSSLNVVDDESGDVEPILSRGGGVVVSRTGGIDPYYSNKGIAGGKVQLLLIKQISAVSCQPA